jgi:hypothetical protein
MTSFFPTDAIRSRLEWNATLNPAAAPQTTEETRYHRKVSTLRIPKQKNQVHLLLRRLLLRPSVSLGEHIPEIRPLNGIRTGPKVNSVEKLARLCDAGVNIGEFRKGRLLGIPLKVYQCA